MTATRVTYDVTDPDFPHGEYAGASRGCDGTYCDGACLTARRRAHKISNVRRSRGIFRKATPEVETRARDHVKFIQSQIPGEIESAICRAAGLSEDLWATYRVRSYRGLSVKAAAAILATTVPAVHAQLRFVPRAGVALKLRQMQALGYPIEWQGREGGFNSKHVVGDARARRSVKESGVTLEVAALVDALYRRIGDTPADPDRDGLTKKAIGMAKAVARRNGAYPPAFYDEDGTLDWRAIPDHPWTVAEEAGHDRIANLERALRNPDMGTRQLTRLTHGPMPPEGTPGHTEWMTAEARNTRMLKRLGIRQIDKDGAARRADLIQTLWRFNRGQGDPVSFCIEVGLLDPTSVSIPNDHPAVVEEREAKAEAGRAAKRTPEYRARANELRRGQRTSKPSETRESVAA